VGGNLTGYSSYSARYGKATILGCSINVLIGDNGTDAANPFALTLTPSRSTAPLTTDLLNSISEVRYSK